ncbi:outer membrane beta-barrel protein [Geomonas sp. Red32]|uniref:outer membrane protein n=1 Tax=Geomonas sp. Red32 TaxID=2912856 RepID=UPI00202CD504|nr:outer membrane beta-barrel protein [Geomonas sp. Red32]MCM0080243.1 outer membrane beta-barrel protein [Geomonas sp. Red32]
MIISRKLAALCAFVAVAAIPAVSFANAPDPGGYISFFAGSSTPQDTTVSTTAYNPVTTKSALVQFDPGINIGGTAGYDFGFVRVEGELSYKEGEMNNVSEPTYGTHYVNVDGHVGAFSAMLNSFFDIHNQSPVTPYLGGGMGFSSVSVSTAKGVDANTGALNYHIFNSDDAVAFAYQLGGGMDLALNRRLSLDVGYRYFGTSRASLSKDWPNSTDLKLASHNATVGLRLKF